MAVNTRRGKIGDFAGNLMAYLVASDDWESLSVTEKE